MLLQSSSSALFVSFFLVQIKKVAFSFFLFRNRKYFFRNNSTSFHSFFCTTKPLLQLLKKNSWTLFLILRTIVQSIGWGEEGSFTTPKSIPNAYTLPETFHIHRDLLIFPKGDSFSGNKQISKNQSNLCSSLQYSILQVAVFRMSVFYSWWKKTTHGVCVF